MGLIRLFMELKYKSNPDLKDLTGVYRGYAPTDESDTGFGELEVSISARLVRSRFATGLEIGENQIPASEFIKMSRKELCDILGEKEGIHDRVAGFNVREYQYFFADPRDEIGLIIRGGNEIPPKRSELYSPEQVRQGMYKQWVARLEKEHGPNCFPTLAANGRLPK